MTYEWQQVAAIQYYLITRSRSLNVLGLLKLRNVLFVNGLKANLINISQLCDQDLLVRFTKDKCIVLDQDQ